MRSAAPRLLRRTLSLVAIAAVLSGSALAYAEPTDAEKDAARILFTEGKELRDAGKPALALERFERAWELAPTPITTVELARTHAMLGHLVEARRLYRTLDSIEKKPGESAKSLAARDEGKQLAAELDKRIPTLVIKVVGLAADESLLSASLDGRPLELSALASPLAVDPGKHVVGVRGKTEGSATVVAIEGERDRLLEIELPKAAPAKPPPGGPPPPVEPPRGGGGTPARPTSTWTTVRWVSGITGGVALLAGAGAGVLALTSASDVRDGCAGSVCPPSRHDALDTTRRWATISTIGFGLAAVSATVFVVGVVKDPGKKDVAGPTVTAYASLDGFGLLGRF